jgi:lysophospholipase L1-like esterase
MSGLFVHDDLLGHVPNPGFSGPGFGRSFHTIDADGLRFGGERPVSGGGSILTVGDSFTYGDEVRDEETWPAQLQRLTGRPVLNGGVTGYGFDQMVLRAEQLVAKHSPAVVILSFIDHDIERTEMRLMWWRAKPWFAIEDDQLAIKGVPVPHRTRLPPHIRWRMDVTLNRLPLILQNLLGYHRRVHRSGFGLEITKRLIERLARMQADRNLKIVIMVQYTPATWINRRYQNYLRRRVQVLLDCAATHGIATVDTFSRLATEPAPQDFYANMHMNARGNLMIASLLAARLPALTG